MGKLTHLEREIERTRAKLIIKADKKGLYEDFGQTEVIKLKEKFCGSGNHIDEMHNHIQITEFSDWCSSYNPRR